MRSQCPTAGSEAPFLLYSEGTKAGFICKKNGLFAFAVTQTTPVAPTHIIQYVQVKYVHYIWVRYTEYLVVLQQN